MYTPYTHREAMYTPYTHREVYTRVNKEEKEAYTRVNKGEKEACCAESLPLSLRFVGNEAQTAPSLLYPFHCWSYSSVSLSLSGSAHLRRLWRREVSVWHYHPFHCWSRINPGCDGMWRIVEVCRQAMGPERATFPPFHCWLMLTCPPVLNIPDSYEPRRPIYRGQTTPGTITRFTV